MAKNIYIELAFSPLNLERFNKAWDSVIARYPQLSEKAVPYLAQHYDLREYMPTKQKQIQVALRKKLQTASLDKKIFPWFSIITTQPDDNIMCVHMAIVPDFLNDQQIYHLLREWQTLYENPTLSLEPIELNTAGTETVFLSKPMHRYYEHFIGKLDHKTFAGLRANSEKEHTSLPLTLVSVFKDELDKQGKDLPVYLTLANRFPIFPHMYDRAAFATSINLFPLEFDEKGSFAKRCQSLETYLRQASLNLKPETSKVIPVKGKKPFALFTCTLDQDLPHAPMSITIPHILYSNIDLPLVAVELQAWQYAGQLFYRWSYLTQHSEEEKIPSTEMTIFTPEKDAEFNMNDLGDKEKKFTDVRKTDFLNLLKQHASLRDINNSSSEDDTTPEDEEHLQVLSDETDDITKLTSLRINAKKLSAPIASLNIEKSQQANADNLLQDGSLDLNQAKTPEQKKSSGINVAALITGGAAAIVGSIAAANTQKGLAQTASSGQPNGSPLAMNNQSNNGNSNGSNNNSQNQNTNSGNGSVPPSNAANNFNVAMQQNNNNSGNSGSNANNISQPMLGGNGSNNNAAASSGVFNKASISSVAGGIASTAGSAASAITQAKNGSSNNNAQNNNGNGSNNSNVQNNNGNGSNNSNGQNNNGNGSNNSNGQNNNGNGSNNSNGQNNNGNGNGSNNSNGQNNNGNGSNNSNGQNNNGNNSNGQNNNGNGSNNSNGQNNNGNGSNNSNGQNNNGNGSNNSNGQNNNGNGSNNSNGQNNNGNGSNNSNGQNNNGNGSNNGNGQNNNGNCSNNGNGQNNNGNGSNSTPTPPINGSLKNAFGDMGSSINELADENGTAWAAEKEINPNIANAANNGMTSLTEAERQAYAENLKKLPSDSPAVEFANSLDSIKDNLDDLTPPSINDVPKPDLAELDTPEDVSAAAEAYKEKVAKLHRIPSKADLATEDLNQKLSDNIGGVGADLPKVQPELENLGGKVDSFSQDLQNGDMGGAKAKLSQVTDAHAALVNKMSTENITAVASEAPLVGASADIADSAQGVTDLASAEALQGKIDSFKTNLTDYQSKLSQDAAPLIADKTAEINDSMNSPQVLALQDNVAGLQTSVSDCQSMTCESICANKAAASEKVAALETSTAALAPTMPTNPVDGKLDDLTASTDQLSSLPPEISADDPRFQDAIGSVKAKTSDLADTVSKGCPICRGPATPDMPAIPTTSTPNAELPALTNPLKTPSLNLDSAKSSLDNLKGLKPDAAAVVEKCKTSLTGLKDQCNITNPLANIGSLSDVAKGAADNNPYKKLQDLLGKAVDPLKAKIGSLQMCPTFTDASGGPSLKERMTGATDQLSGMKDGLKTSMSGAVDGQVQKLGNVRESLSGAAAKFKNPDVKAQVSDQLGSVSATSGCMEGLNVPDPSAPSPGGPQTVLVSGFKAKCNFGSTDATFNVPKAGVDVDGKEMVKTPQDTIPFVSSSGCGPCKSMMHPPTLAATAAAMGSLTPMPCLKPILTLPIGAQKTQAFGQTAATKMTPVLCPFGGMLTISDPGQTKTTVV